MNVILLDDDNNYIESLVNYLSKNVGDEINIDKASNIKILDTYVQEGADIDLVITKQKYYEHVTYILPKARVLLFKEEADLNIKDNEIFKYQPVSNILDKIIRVCNQMKYSDENKTKIITFISPIGGIGTTTICSETAKKLAEEGKVLFINFEKIQIRNNIISNKESTTHNSFSDVILSLHENEDNFLSSFKGSLEKKDELELFYFNIVDSLIDIETISSDNLMKLFELIRSNYKFKYIIVDMSSNIDSKYNRILESSHKVFTLCGQGYNDLKKLESMFKQIDYIKNYRLIFNFCKANKQVKIPEIISKNDIPIVCEIPFFDNVFHESNDNDIYSKIFDTYVNKIVNMI